MFSFEIRCLTYGNSCNVKYELLLCVFAGFKPSVYLPLYIPVESCVKAPLYLCYRRGHFAPLVFVEQRDTGKSSGEIRIEGW